MLDNTLHTITKDKNKSLIVPTRSEVPKESTNPSLCLCRVSRRGPCNARPANFLDLGGTADAARVEKAFRIILKDPTVKAILVNIFGGIVRCDRVAQGVVDAYKNIGDITVPIIVRLQGTNAIEAKKLIDDSGLKVLSAVALQEAADRVKEVLK